MYIEVITKNKHGLAVGAKVSLSTHAARTMVAEGSGKLIGHAEFANANVSLKKQSKAIGEQNMTTKEDKATTNEETKEAPAPEDPETKKTGKKNVK